MLEVLIVGCGNIAGAFDARRAEGELPLTHAGAYVRDGRFRLTACVEPDDGRREAFMKKWHVPVGFPSMEAVLGSARRYDVVSVCSPTACHSGDVQASLQLSPKLVFCEKPFTDSLAEGQRLIEAVRQSGALLAVNYTRRWDPEIEKLRETIQRHRLGPLRCVVGYYNKGLLNNGSHLLDLLNLLLGKLEVVAVGDPIADFSPADHSVPVWLKAAGELPVHIACGNAQDFALLELEMVFSEAVVRMEEGGLYWRDRLAGSSQTFAGYRVPGDAARRAGGYAKSMTRAVGNLFDAITMGTPLASTGETALSVQRLCEEILRS